MNSAASMADRVRLSALLPSRLLDLLRGLNQPVRRVCLDLAAFLRVTAAARRWMRTGHLDRALEEKANLVTKVQHCRESLGTYREIERFLRSHSEQLGHHLPDDGVPERLVLFVGQSRSGHSLVGSLIDAHPDAVIAHEIHAMKHLLRGADLAELSRAIRLNAHLFDLLGRTYTGYDYVVPGQWQGRYRNSLVVGDKKGNGTTRLLRRHPGGLKKLEARLDLPITFINVIRNPFDNIATKAKRTGVSVTEAARRFLRNAETLDALTRARPEQVKTLYLDALIDEPKSVLADLVDWLGLKADEPGYLDAAASLVFDRPKRTRDHVDWPTDLTEHLRGEFARYTSLARFADEPR